MRSVLRFLVGRLKDMLNVPGLILGLLELGRRHGRGFLIYAVLVALLEKALIPVLIWLDQVQLMPLVLGFHLEPIAYPLYFLFARRVGPIEEGPAEVSHDTWPVGEPADGMEAPPSPELAEALRQLEMPASAMAPSGLPRPAARPPRAVHFDLD